VPEIDFLVVPHAQVAAVGAEGIAGVRIGCIKPLSFNMQDYAKYELAEPRELAPELIESQGVRVPQKPLFEAVLDRPSQLRNSPARRDAGAKRPTL